MTEIISKNEEKVKAILEEEPSLEAILVEPSHGNWLFCQLRPPKSRRDINQWRHVAICRKIECKYLTEEGKSDCHSPTSLQYLGGLKKISQEEIIHARKEKKAGRRLDEDEDEEDTALQNPE